MNITDPNAYADKIIAECKARLASGETHTITNFAAGSDSEWMRHAAQHIDGAVIQPATWVEVEVKAASVSLEQAHKSGLAGCRAASAKLQDWWFTTLPEE